MIHFLVDNKDAILTTISISSFIISLYALFRDKRKITLDYSLKQSDKGKHLLLHGILANPSKTPNSIIQIDFFCNGTKIECARFHDGGFDMGNYHRPSPFSPILLTQPISVGASLPFAEVLKLENITRDDELVMVLRTANYRKSFRLKLKDSI